MNIEPLALEDLVESIADGKAVDWDELTPPRDVRTRRMVGHLRIVAGIADVHRTMAVEAGGQATLETTHALDAGGAAGEQWGHLVLVSLIGEGGFSQVYRARDTWLDREVALKLLKPSATPGAGTLHVVDEARTLARVRHPNVVCIHGADVHDSRAGLWMELVRGRTLSQILSAQGPFSAKEAAAIGQDICGALAAVHAEHLIHHDVKAQNVMRESGGRIVLMDFGAGHTPMYLAPEVLAGGSPSAAADLYALGVLLFFLVTGEFPASGATVEDLRRVHATGARRRLSDVRPSLPDAFVTVVERALQADPSLRFQTAGEMKDALAESLGNIVEPPPTPAPLPFYAAPTPRPWRRAWVAAALAVVVAGVAMFEWWPSRPASDVPIRMVAIMPLRSASDDSPYLADGMTEALMQGLSRIRTVRVISRTSIDKAQAAAASLPEIARALSADAILEGAVHQTNDRVRVDLRLIYAGSDTPVWARSFNEPLGNVFALQDRVARAVAEEWAAVISPSAGGQSPMNAAAYDAYLHGRYESRKATELGVRTALDYFQQAVALEPRFSRALVGMAQSYLSLGGEYSALPARESAASAREYAQRALDLDGSLAEAHATMASIRFEVDWDFAGADQDFRKAIELDPSAVTPRENYSMFLTSRARVDEALGQLAAARGVDPLSASVANLTAQAQYFGRHYDEALPAARRALELDASTAGAHVGLARTLSAMHRYDEALAEYGVAARESSSDHPFFQTEIAQVEIALGERDRAMARIRKLEEQLDGTPGSKVAPYMLALCYAQIDPDRSFKWFDEEFGLRSGHVLWLAVDPRVDPLRADPRFANYLTRLGLR